MPQKLKGRAADGLKVLERLVARFRRMLRNAPDKAGVRCQPGSSDAHAGFHIDPDRFARMSQRDDVFNRAQWDPAVAGKRVAQFFAGHRKLSKEWDRRGSGFGQRDFALRNASWHLTDWLAEWRQHEDRHEGFHDAMTSLQPQTSTKVAVADTKAAAQQLKLVAKTYGAEVVGITAHDTRWHYKRKHSRFEQKERPNNLLLDADNDARASGRKGGFGHQDRPAETQGEHHTETTSMHKREQSGCPTDQSDLNTEAEALPNVIVIGTAMDRELIQSVPSALSSASVGMGYSRDALTLLTLSQYIRNLGYRAVPSMNDSANAIPYAIQAGLGEYGRNGLLITPRLGPRVRLGKVFTDMPLAHDTPIKFGVKEFCEQCLLCAEGCPARAISFGSGQEEEVHNRSNLQGVHKWSTDAEKCFGWLLGLHSMQLA